LKEEPGLSVSHPVVELKHDSEGDCALEAGHLRIAVEHHEAAEKALGK